GFPASLPETDSFFRYLYALGSVGDVLSSAKRKLVVKRPPSPGDIHDVTRRARNPSQHGNRRAIGVCGRSPERSPGWVPVIQGRGRSAACLGCNGFPTL